jgi:23S rRNA (adenine-N6)-dimethyltransferase
MINQTGVGNAPVFIFYKLRYNYCMKMKYTIFPSYRALWQAQNFLKSEYVTKILNRIPFVKDDFVVEIGPGLGSITKELSKRIKKILAVELDPKLCAILRNDHTLPLNVDIIEGNILKLSMPTEPYKVVANIPFNMTAEIMKRVTKEDSFFQGAYFIMQREAGIKYCGKPFGKERLASLILKPWFDIKIIMSIPNQAFVPKPTIQVILLSIVPKTPPLIHPKEKRAFQDFVTYGFSMKEKSIIDNYSKVFSINQKKQIKSKLDLRNKSIADAPLEVWLHLFSVFQNFVSPKNKQRVLDSYLKLNKEQLMLQKYHRTRRF